MKINTPQQIEDQEILDAINTAVSFEGRRLKRHLVNYLKASVSDEVDLARLNGREVDVDKFIRSALTTARYWNGELPPRLK